MAPKLYIVSTHDCIWWGRWIQKFKSEEFNVQLYRYWLSIEIEPFGRVLHRPTDEFEERHPWYHDIYIGDDKIFFIG